MKLFLKNPAITWEDIQLQLQLEDIAVPTHIKTDFDFLSQYYSKIPNRSHLLNQADKKKEFWSDIDYWHWFVLQCTKEFLEESGVSYSPDINLTLQIKKQVLEDHIKNLVDVSTVTVTEEKITLDFVVPTSDYTSCMKVAKLKEIMESALLASQGAWKILSSGAEGKYHVSIEGENSRSFYEKFEQSVKGVVLLLSDKAEEEESDEEEEWENAPVPPLNARMRC